MKPATVFIPTNFPPEFEPVVHNKNDATDYELRLRPLQDFSRQKAILKLEKALTQNPRLFQPNYEQSISLNRPWIKQNDPSSEINLNPLCSSFFDDGNDLSVSVLILPRCVSY